MKTSASPGSPEGCDLVVAVFGYEKMCAPAPAPVRVVVGPHELRVGGPYQASLVGRVHSLLESCGLEILRVERGDDPDCLALLIHARGRACGAANVRALRAELEEAARELGVTVRVQRAELFSSMHRV